MDQNLDMDSSESNFNSETPQVTMTSQIKKPNNSNQCEYASSEAGDLRKHLKTHIGDKPNKCDQCDYASSRVGHLRTHLKTHSGEKSNKCNQCDFASSQLRLVYLDIMQYF